MKIDKLINYRGLRGIYKIHNAKNNFSYIGESANIEKRLIEHFSLIAPITSNLLYIDLKTLDWSKISIEILSTYDDLSVDTKIEELKAIQESNSIYPNGYNIYGDENSLFKEWIEFDNKNYTIIRKIESTGKNLFYENSKLTKSTLIPSYINDYIVKGHYSKYCSLDFFIMYYKLNNVIILSEDLKKIKGIKAKDILETSPNNLESLTIGLEKSLYNNQIKVDGNSYVNLTEKFKYRDVIKLDFNTFLSNIIKYFQNSTSVVIKELYEKLIFEKLTFLYGEKSISRLFALGNFINSSGNHILLIKYPYIGYFKDRLLNKIFKTKKIVEDIKAITIDENSIMFLSKREIVKILKIDISLRELILGNINSDLLTNDFYRKYNEIKFVNNL